MLLFHYDVKLFHLVATELAFDFNRSIQRILRYPPTRTLNGEEKQLLWKFRFSLMAEKRALTKFLRCVEWSDIQVKIS